MSDLNIKPETLREYLLGGISDEKKLEEIEELLFTDEDFCTQAELTEDELINEYTFKRLTPEDTTNFEASLKNNPDRKLKVQLAQSLKEKAKVEIVEEKAGFFDPIKAILRQPLYGGAFAVLIIAVLFSTFYLLTRQDSGELVQLKKIYQTERPFETRISDFEYAPYVAERSEKIEEQNKNKLRLIENKLLEAVENNPTAENRHALGVFYLTQKKFEDSIRELKKATELNEKNARFRNDLGSAYFEFAKNGKRENRLENITNANEEFSNALELNENFLEALFNKSIALEELNLPRRAKESWEEYLKKDSTSKWADEARKRLEQLSNKENSSKTREQVLQDFLTAYQNGDFAKAIKIHNETKGLFTPVSIFFQLTKRYLEAKKKHNPGRATETLKALNYIGDTDKKTYADFFISELAAYYLKIEDSKIAQLTKAHEHFEKGYEAIKIPDYAKSIREFELSKNLFQTSGNEHQAKIAELWIGQMMPDVGKIDESQTRLNALIENAEKRKFKVLIPTAYYWLGVGDFRQNHYSKARNRFKQALEVAEDTNNFFEIKHSSHDIAQNYVFLGEIENSQIFFEKTLSKENSYFTTGSGRWRDLFTFAELQGKLGNNSTAIDVAKESLYLSREVLPRTEAVNNSLQRLIAALARKKRFDEALKYADESNKIALSRKEGSEQDKVIADTYLVRADVKKDMKNCSEAIKDYEKSLQFYQKIPQIEYNLYNVHKGKLLCFQNLQQQDNFNSELKTILNISEEYRQNIREDETRQAFFNNEQIVFDAAISDSLKQNDSRKAFEFVETSKSRSLLDFVKSDKLIAELENEFSAIAKPLSIEEIQKRMPENTQIVQYVLLEDKLAIWVLTQNRFDLIEKRISTAEIEKKIDKYRKSILSKSISDEMEQTAREFYELLIPTDLEKEKTLCIVLDKSLHQIPFASLITSQGKYLIEDLAILNSPSASVFVLASENAKRKEQQTKESLLSVGNPRFNREENPKLTDLPDAEIEAKTIAKSYSTSQIFIGVDATKENFLNTFENAEIIHFAGHFVANGRSSENSKLVFADESLRSFEFSRKKLPRSKLVVLSACETGFEKFNKSEGAIGIARTFLALGTPVVVASSWKVDSEITKNLMISFHQKRRQQNLSTIESLRQTQIGMIKNERTRSPYYWSAFSTIGGFSSY